MLSSVLPEKVFGRIKDEPFGFVTTVSFEDRATTWSERLISFGCKPAKVFIFDYTTPVLPRNQDVSKRNSCRNTFRELFKDTEQLVSFDKTNAFATNLLNIDTHQTLENCKDFILLIDISCMTRVHLFSIVSAIFSLDVLDKVVFCYTVPVSYGFMPKDKYGWQDTLFLPIGTSYSFRREGQGRGIVLAGYDEERLSVALGELEPAAGVMIYTDNTNRPDFARRALEANRITSDRLKNIRMPRFGIQPKDDSLDGWSFERVSITNFQDLRDVIKPQIDQAVHEESPVILYPFGPKPVSLFVSILLRELLVDDAWAVYPVPECFSAFYSSGSAELLAFSSLE